MMTFANLGSIRLPSLKFVGLRLRKIRRIQCVSCLQQFPSYWNHNRKKSSILRTPAFIFCLPWGRPCGNHAKRCMNEKTIQRLPNPSQNIPIYLQQFPVIRTARCKNSPFSRTAAHIFVSPGDAPAVISNMLHGWKDNLMLVKPLHHIPIYLKQFPSYTMLKSMRKSKNRYFYHIFNNNNNNNNNQICIAP